MAQPQTAIANARSRQQWAEIIKRRCAQSAVQIGQELLAAKDELAHGEFTAMIENDLGWGYQTARDLMRIAAHPEIANSYNSNFLPTTLSALKEVSTLSPEDFRDATDKGLITSDLKVKPARAIAGAYNKPEGEVIGGAQHMLPSADEARKIARETGRLVAAADGYTYSGATREEERSYADRRTAAFRIIEAIQLLSEAPDARQWLRSAEQRWFLDFRPSGIDEAREWLAALKEAMEIVDA